MTRPAARPEGDAAPLDHAEPALPAAVTRQPGRGLPRALASLRHRNYRLYWFGQLISLAGTFMQTTGQAWLVLQLTRDPVQLGLVGALQFLPVLLFSLFGGVFADRWPKRSLLLVTTSVAMAQAFVLWALVATNAIQLWQLYTLAVLLGLTTSLDQPVRSAFVVELVSREDLPNAVAVNALPVNVARVLGPGLGGVIIAASGVTALFLLNGLSFLAALTALLLMRSRELYAQPARQQDSSAPTRQSTWHSLREGLTYVGRTLALRLVIVVVGVVLLFGANFNVVLPLFATDVLHAGPTGFGYLSAALGIGALFSSVWLAWTHLRPTIGRVLIGTLLFTLLEAAFAVSRLYPLSVAFIAGIGAAEGVFGALAVTTLQTVTPDSLRGRVNGVFIVCFTGSIPVGYLLAGWLSAAIGPTPGLLICDALCLLAVAAGWLWRAPAERDIAASVRLSDAAT
jgi:MFS family permease